MTCGLIACCLLAEGWLALPDTFEDVAPGTTAGQIAGWHGDGGTVEVRSYAAPTPPGFVLTNATHAQVLFIGSDTVRDVPTEAAADKRMEFMMCFSRAEEPLPTPAEDVQVELAADTNGFLCLWHGRQDAGGGGWTVLSERPFADGEWLRIEVEFDSGFAKVRVNGSTQVSERGFRKPDGQAAGGCWHRLAGGAAGGLKEVCFFDTKVGDLLFCTKDTIPAESGPTSTNGIAFSWFDRNGLPRDPDRPAPCQKGRTLANLHDAGLDPYAAEPFRVTEIGFDANGQAHLRFNGYRGDKPAKYSLLYSPTFDFAEPTVIGTGSFTGDSATWTTTWRGVVPQEPKAGFLKVKAVR